MNKKNTWHNVSNPIKPDESIPAERRVVLVWLKDVHVPFCAYIRYASGQEDCPYFVVYHGNIDIGTDVVAWCNCLPDLGPNIDVSKMYNKEQKKGRGFPKRVKNVTC